MPISRRVFTCGAAASVASCVLPLLSGCQVMETLLPDKSLPRDWDVIVIGAGGAGMCAAISAFDAGAQVLVLEKTLQTGGNTSYTESGMNAAGTSVQAAAGINDTSDAFAEDTLVGGHNTGNAELVHYLCNSSADALAWLESLGVTLDSLAATAGMHVKRAHRPTNNAPIGSVLVPALEAALSERNIPVLTGAPARSLVLDSEGTCVGVVAADAAQGEVTYTARSVVLATGGMCSNLDMVTTYRPDLEGCVSTNQPASTGDGFTMAQDVGAQLIQMDHIQIHPTVALQASTDGRPPTLIPDALRTAGAILVNANAERFFDETAEHSYMAEAILNQPGQLAWLVFDETVRQGNPAVQAIYEPRGLVVQGSNLAVLAQHMNLNAEALQKNMTAYYDVISQDAPDSFGRKTGRRVFEGSLYGIKVGVGAHYQMGGVSIDTLTRTLNASGHPIAGLFAAGEVTGGVHGWNRLGGNGVCDAVVYGRTAGLEAAGYASVIQAVGQHVGTEAGVSTGIVQEMVQPGATEG